MSKRSKVKIPRIAKKQVVLQRPWWKIGISFTVTLLGVVAAAVTLMPRVVVTASDPVDAMNPFSASIEIENTGYLPLHSVSVFVSPDKILFSRGTQPIEVSGKTRFGSRIHRTDWGKPDLPIDEGFTVGLDDIMSIPREHLLAANIAVIVDYEIPWIHVKREKIFPLSATRKTNGNFYWYKKSPST